MQSRRSKKYFGCPKHKRTAGQKKENGNNEENEKASDRAPDPGDDIVDDDNDGICG